MSLPRLFFFHAEDGIRYHCVTGVQTCALPISIRSRARVADVCLCDCLGRLRPGGRHHRVRSEERRVGKGFGTQTSSQLSTCNVKPATLTRSYMTSLPKVTRSPMRSTARSI